MSRWTILIGAASTVVVVTSLVACGGGKKSGGATATAGASTPTTIARGATVVRASSSPSGNPGSGGTAAPGGTALAGSTPGAQPTVPAGTTVPAIVTTGTPQLEGRNGPTSVPTDQSQPQGTPTPDNRPPVQQTAESSEGTMVLDMNPDTADIEAKASVPAGGTFKVAVVLTNVDTSYLAYAFNVAWDPKVVDFKREDPLKPDTLKNCAPLNVYPDASAYGACFGLPDETTYQGQLTILTFACVGMGDSPLVLQNDAETGGLGSGIAKLGGIEIPIILRGGEVTCG